ncbi:hypothetical protein [Bacillus sp. FSL M8-0350]|uniref:hypothetical protein n=1 Tax=Bacillus sp. FSL M8-0350 TaxID=2954579 RepID=UPI00315B3C94
MGYIFTTGTCLKSDLYSVIKNSLINAGWENKSSNATSDYDVFYSTGESGDKKLVFQMRATDTTDKNSIISTDYCAASLRLIETYTPGSNGVAGTVGRPSEPWKYFMVSPSSGTLSKDTTMTYRLNVNKNRLIIVIESPSATGIGSVLNYIGIPDEIYADEPDSRGLIFATTSRADAVSNLIISNSPVNIAPATSATVRPIIVNLSPKNPNTQGLYMLSEFYYGNTSEGTRGKLTGIYGLPNDNVLHGSIIEDGSRQYFVVVPGVFSSNTFGSAALAIEVTGY